jgi:serine/threonine protein kinase
MNKFTMEKKKSIDKTLREIMVHKSLRHINICELLEVIDFPDEIWLVLDYCEGGELFDHVVKSGTISETVAREYFRQLITAVDYIHSLGVVHRDLKNENILLDVSGNLKIIDFGLTNVFQKDCFLKTFCGSPSYVAPEMLLGKPYAAPPIDIWSSGVILFSMVAGYLPFDDINLKKVCTKIITANYTFPSHFSDSLKDLISKIFVLDPKDRITLEEIRIHSWTNIGFSKMVNFSATGSDDIELNARNTDNGYIDSSVVNDLKLLGFNDADVEILYSKEPSAIKTAYFLYRKKKARLERSRNDNNIITINSPRFIPLNETVERFTGFPLNTTKIIDDEELIKHSIEAAGTSTTSFSSVEDSYSTTKKDEELEHKIKSKSFSVIKENLNKK